MGWLARVFGIEKKNDDGAHGVDVVVDLGGGNLATVEHFADPGEDSPPLTHDVAAGDDAPGQGNLQAYGYADTKNPSLASPGEKRTYARDPQGNTKCHVWQKGDGTIVIEVLNQGTAPIEIKSQGTILVQSPDVRIGSAPGRKVACIGDMVSGSIKATVALPSVQPLLPAPGATPTPSGGVPFTAKIISGVNSVKAGP
jgi:hypothetical protein